MVDRVFAPSALHLADKLQVSAARQAYVLDEQSVMTVMVDWCACQLWGWAATMQ